MTSEITTDPSAEVPRDAPVNIRTALGADAIGEALINNLHCPQAKLRQGRYLTSMENGAAA
jgi:hypothetical protein